MSKIEQRLRSFRHRIKRRRIMAGTYGGSIDLRDPKAWLRLEDVLGGRNIAGVTVSSETALTVPAYFAILRVVSAAVAMLPRVVFRRRNNAREKLWDHPTSRLMRNPNPLINAMNFWETLVHHALGWGNGYARIISRMGEPTELWPLPPWNVEPRMDRGQLWYRWKRSREIDGDSDIWMLMSSEVFHIHGLGSTGFGGYSLIEVGAHAIAQGLAHQQYGSAFFANGAWGGGVIQTPQAMTQEAYERLKANIEDEAVGPSNAFKQHIGPLLLEGAEWKQRTIPNKDAQLIEVGAFNVLQICRLAGVPPQKVFDLSEMHYDNIEQMNLEWKQDGLMPWTTRIEQEAVRKLLPGLAMSEPLYIRHNFDALLQADFQTRMSGHQTAINTGLKSINEVREKEDMDRIPEPWADAHYMQGANKTVEDIFAGEPEPPPPPPPGPAPGLPEPEDEEEEEAQAVEFRTLAQALFPVYRAAADQVVRRSRKAVGRAHEKFLKDPDRLRDWAVHFHREELAFILDAFEPALQALSETAKTTGASDGISVDLTLYLHKWEAEALERTMTLQPPPDEAVDALARGVFDLALGAVETSCET